MRPGDTVTIDRRRHPPVPWKCPVDGEAFYIRQPGEDEPDLICDTHHEELERWEREKGSASYYLDRMAEAGEDLERFVETFDTDMFPGVSRGIMALVLSYRKKWRDLPAKAAPTTPAGLFGGRKNR
jgi:hypothetical protein